MRSRIGCTTGFETEQSGRMPSLVRFLVLVGTLACLVIGGLYAMATFYDPPVGEVTKSVSGVSIRRQ